MIGRFNQIWISFIEKVTISRLILATSDRIHSDTMANYDDSKELTVLFTPIVGPRADLERSSRPTLDKMERARYRLWILEILSGLLQGVENFIETNIN